MAFKKVEKFGATIKFEEEGDNFTGIPVKVEKDCKTSISKEPVDFVRMESPDDDEIHSLCISASLKGFPWEEWIEVKQLIQITYMGEELNKATKRKYKLYEVAIDDGVPN